MKIQIKHRYTGDVIFEVEASSFAVAVVKATEQKASLDRADLSNQNFSFVNIETVGASFDGASFDGAIFVGARFVGASFVGASFVGAIFVGASFDGAIFDGAIFVGASFDGARFHEAFFHGAIFVGASFDGASFVGASFDETSTRSLGAAWFSAKADLWMTLLSAPLEVAGLLAAVREGRIDGSQYTGTCACLVGTIANIRGCGYGVLNPDANRPAERWFMGIRPKQTPENHPISKITAEWIEEWQALFGIAVASVTGMSHGVEVVLPIA